jgi:aspartyl protease family protein
MAFSSGTRSLLGEVASWSALAVVAAVGIIHFDALKALTAQLAGLPTAAEISGAEATAKSEATAPAVELRGGAHVELRASANGHFLADAEINGRPIEVMVDTGATMVALTYEDAERAGIYLKKSDFTHGVSTANGTARVAPVVLDRVSIGDITVRNVKAAVSERGRLQTTLLGMSFLSRLERFDMRSGVLVLEE